MKLGVIALVMGLVMIGGVMGAEAEEVSTGASITVNKFVDITLGGVTPINFGSEDPGSLNNPAGGAVTVTIESTTNIVTDTHLKGSDWTSPTTLAISNVKYDDDGIINTDEVTMSTSYGAANTGYFENVACPCGGPAVVKSLYFWLSIPPGQQAGSYTGANVYIKTVEDGVAP